MDDARRCEAAALNRCFGDDGDDSDADDDPYVPLSCSSPPKCAAASQVCEALVAKIKPVSGYSA